MSRAKSKKTDTIKLKLIGLGLLFGGVAAGVIWFVRSHAIAVLVPAGTIGAQQRSLIVFALTLSLVVVVPVFIMLFTFAWRYREGNQKAKYSPEWSHSRTLETIWWAVPSALILVLSVLAWRSAHELDPFKPLASTKKPLTVQVVALQWKWLFIYPGQHVATVNYVPLPVDRPINFVITADAPMNSFWIPQLGGQVYAMSGMSTQLHLEASKAGDYRGSSANISGTGFAGMSFTAEARSPQDFRQWAMQAQHSKQRLTEADYLKLAKPSQQNPRATYSHVQANLYDTIVMKYMHPTQGSVGTEPR